MSVKTCDQSRSNWPMKISLTWTGNFHHPDPRNDYRCC